MGLHSRLGTCLDLCGRLVHAMDTENNVRTCSMKRVYSVYTLLHKVYKVRERRGYRSYNRGEELFRKLYREGRHTQDTMDT